MRRGRALRPFQAALERLSRIVNQMLVLSRTGRKAEALAMYAGLARGLRCGQRRARGTYRSGGGECPAASDRLAVAYRQAFWLILPPWDRRRHGRGRSDLYQPLDFGPLLHLADWMRRLAANDTDIDILETERR